MGPVVGRPVGPGVPGVDVEPAVGAAVGVGDVDDPAPVGPGLGDGVEPPDGPGGEGDTLPGPGVAARVGSGAGPPSRVDAPGRAVAVPAGDRPGSIVATSLAPTSGEAPDGSSGGPTSGMAPDGSSVEPPAPATSEGGDAGPLAAARPPRPGGFADWTGVADRAEIPPRGSLVALRTSPSSAGLSAISPPIESSHVAASTAVRRRGSGHRSCGPGDPSRPGPGGTAILGCGPAACPPDLTPRSMSGVGWRRTGGRASPGPTSPETASRRIRHESSDSPCIRYTVGGPVDGRGATDASNPDTAPAGFPGPTRPGPTRSPRIRAAARRVAASTIAAPARRPPATSSGPKLPSRAASPCSPARHRTRRLASLSTRCSELGDETRARRHAGQPESGSYSLHPASAAPNTLKPPWRQTERARRTGRRSRPVRPRRSRPSRSGIRPGDAAAAGASPGPPACRPGTTGRAPR